MELLSENVRSNAPSARVCRLVWGSEGDPLKTLGLTREPDVVLASDVVYGNDPKKWRALVATMRALCGAHTLVVVGNVQRYPVHHPMAESRFFRESTRAFFVRREVPVTSLHPEYRGTGAGSCAVHVLRRRAVGLGDARERGDGDEDENENEDEDENDARRDRKRKDITADTEKGMKEKKEKKKKKEKKETKEKRRKA